MIQLFLILWQFPPNAFAVPQVTEEVYGFRNNDVKQAMQMQVPFGETVTLTCTSNDDDHNFLYWHLNEKNIIVGPTNNQYDNGKFKYEVLSGNLTIKAVSKAEEGVYNCVSRGVTKDDFNIRSIHIRVEKDLNDVYEHDPSVNLLRVVIILGTLMIVGGVGYMAYRIWKNRFRNPSYLVPSDDEEEDSAYEIFTAPATTSSRTIVRNNSTLDDNFESPGISTDFKSILDTKNNV